MAGDTHDFEYYREIMDGGRVMHHFVNGGGGAYLSIGTALDFPNPPATADWAFYPRTDRLRAKLDAETPVWKQPFWYWIKWLDAWPFSIEALSGIFDFNHAAFFLSFMEVRVERSKRQVVLVLNGIHGPLHWSDLQTGGAVVPSGAIADESRRIYHTDGRRLLEEGIARECLHALHHRGGGGKELLARADQPAAPHSGHRGPDKLRSGR
jgi:hypothetical protein